MGLLHKFREGLKKTQAKLTHEIKRIFSGSPRLTVTALEELEAALIGADFGMAMTTQIVAAVKKSYETQGSAGPDIAAVARHEVENSLAHNLSALHYNSDGLTVVSLVGVNGTGKTTAAAKLAHWTQAQGQPALLAACDTFRAAAIEATSPSNQTTKAEANGAAARWQG